MGQSALILNTDKLIYPIEQVAHGFLAGNIVRYDKASAIWVKAQADSEANAAGAVQVSLKISDDFFYYTQVGTTYDLTSQVFVTGDTYWLSPTTAGELTNVKPTAVGQVELECFKATGTDKGLFWGGAGQLVQSGSLFQWNTVAINTVMASNNGYITSGAGNISLELPAAPTDGDIIKIATQGTGIITITQTAFTDVRIVDQISTNGVLGTVTLQPTGGQLKGTLELLCITPLLEWMVVNGTGIWTPA
jgi:hypothetical protein